MEKMGCDGGRKASPVEYFHFMDTLDSTDLQILRALQENSQRTTKELAQCVNLSSTPVFERLKRLEKKGYIKKYVAVLDAEKLNQGFRVFCTVKMSRLRQVIAERMIDSMQTSAQLTTVVEVDVTRVAALRARAKNDFLAKNGTKLTFLPFFVQAATEALKAHPKINASIEGKNVTYHDVEHVGIAVDTPRGLLVPVVKNAGDLNIPGLAKRINDLAARTRDNKVNPDELSGSTFTITNTGSGGALFDTPIINQPEVAILGLGAIQRQPRVIKDADGGEVIAIRSVCYLALSYDHRLVDGADAARYLMTVKKRLEEGDFGGELGL